MTINLRPHLSGREPFPHDLDPAVRYGDGRWDGVECHDLGAHRHVAVASPALCRHRLLASAARTAWGGVGPPTASECAAPGGEPSSAPEVRRAMPKLQPSSRQRRTWARIAWAMPCSLIGAAAGLAVLALGGSVRREQGVLEFALPADRGGRLRLRTRWAAITFGHVVLAASPAELTRVRDHEHVHVRQYERLGPFFLVAYPLASLAAWWRGGQAYRDNRFEIQAREGSAAAADGPPGGPAEAGGRPQPFC